MRLTDPVTGPKPRQTQREKERYKMNARIEALGRLFVQFRTDKQFMGYKLHDLDLLDEFASRKWLDWGTRELLARHLEDNRELETRREP